MSETTAAFAEIKKRFLKNISYCYMEDYRFEYINKMSHYVTFLTSKKNCSIDLIPKSVKISNCLSILYNKPLGEHKKPKFRVSDRVRISKYDWHFRRSCQPQFTQEVFEILPTSSRKPPTYTIIDEQDEFFLGKVYQKKLIKLIWQ